MQFVDGVSATTSGLRTLPMVVGMLSTSMGSGVLVGRTGRYKIFPIAGSAVMAVAFLLMSRMNPSTSALLQSLYLFILGAGIGLCMQVLILIVQNTSSFEDLGVATSGVTFSAPSAVRSAPRYSDRCSPTSCVAASVRRSRPAAHRRQLRIRRRPCTDYLMPWPRRSSTRMPRRSPRCSCGRSRSRWSGSSWRCFFLRSR
jgi:hypothetical protein